MSQSQIERFEQRPVTEETKEKQRQNNLGKTLSPGTIEKLRLINLGRTHTAASREIMSLNRIGMTFTPEHCANIGLARLGKKDSPETVEKKRIANLRHAKEVMFDGKVYESQAAASRALNIPVNTLKRKIIKTGG